MLEIVKYDISSKSKIKVAILKNSYSKMYLSEDEKKLIYSFCESESHFKICYKDLNTKEVKSEIIKSKGIYLINFLTGKIYDNELDSEIVYKNPRTGKETILIDIIHHFKIFKYKERLIVIPLLKVSELKIKNKEVKIKS